MGQRVGQGQKVHPRNARVDNACVLVWKQLGSVQNLPRTLGWGRWAADLGLCPGLNVHP